MPGRQLSPQDIQSKQIISERLNKLLKESGHLKKDVNNKTGIPNSTLSGYFNGTRLPTPENVEKLANFFHVQKEDIDPRYEDTPSDYKDNGKKTADLADKNTLFTYKGKPLSDEDMSIIDRLMNGKDD